MAAASFLSVSFYIFHLYFLIFRALWNAKFNVNYSSVGVSAIRLQWILLFVAPALSQGRGVLFLCVCVSIETIYLKTLRVIEKAKKRLIKVNIFPLSSVNQFEWNRFPACSIRKLLCVTKDLENSWVSSLSRNTWCFGLALPI